MLPFRSRWKKLHRQGNELLTLERWDEAAACYRKSIAANPDFAESHANLGAAFFKLGRLEDAIAAYRASIRLDDANVVSRLNLARALLKLDRWEESVAAFRHVIARAEGDPEHQLSLASALSQLGRWEEAVMAYDRGFELTPDSPPDAEVTQDTMRLPDGWADSDRISVRDIELSALHLTLATALIHLERWERAVIVLRKTIVLRPDFHPPYGVLGQVLSKLERHAEAVETFRRLIEMEAPVNYTDFGRSLMKAGQIEDSISAYVRAIIMNPQAVDPYHDLAAVLEDVDRFEDATIVYEQLQEKGLGNEETELRRRALASQQTSGRSS